MVSPSTVRSFQTSALRLNKLVASRAGISNGKQLTGYMLGMTGIYAVGTYLMYEYYYKGNKITKMFREERTQVKNTRHGL